MARYTCCLLPARLLAARIPVPSLPGKQGQDRIEPLVQVNISEATCRLLVDGFSSSDDTPTNNDQPTTTFTFTPRGKVQAKGKGELEMYFVSEPS